MFYASLRRSPRAAVMSADQNYVGMAFCHTCGYGTDPHLRDKFNADPRMMIGVLEIVNKLRQILDGINVVMRRWRDQPYPWGRMPHFGNPWVDLAAGQFAAFARLGALSHLDLDLTRLSEIITRYSKPPRSHLLDRAIARVAVAVESVPGRIFSPLAGVAFAAQTVHGNGKRLMRFLADRSVRHRAGFETLDNFVDRFDFFDWNRLGCILYLHETAQGG